MGVKPGAYLKGSYTKTVWLGIIAFVKYFHVAGEKAFSHFSIRLLSVTTFVIYY